MEEKALKKIFQPEKGELPENWRKLCFYFDVYN
jgi:hypothetical protein